MKKQIRKQIASLILALCIALSASAPALAAMSLSNFGAVRTYRGEFADVPPDSWYYGNVAGVFERGLMDGKGGGLFDPAGRLTIAETVKIAATLHKAYHTGEADFDESVPWYSAYRDYAMENGIPVGAYRNLNAWATRSDFAVIIAGALPDEALTPMNYVQDGGIPDVEEAYSYGAAVYRLYRAGVLTGLDGTGAFYPGRTISRAEASALIMRVVDADARVGLSLAPELSAEQIYKLASPAVFYIEVYDDEGDPFRSGSGFFISGEGLAVTNYHILIGADSGKITTNDGEVLDIAGVYDYSRSLDLALIQIEGEGFPYLEFADPSTLQTGATVYTLGSPLGLQASFSRGIVSQALREFEGMNYIQIDAPISSGSSGGALLDAYGRVVGITTATMVGWQVVQNINLAVPIGFLEFLDNETCTPLPSIVIPADNYARFDSVPDFGAFFDVGVFRSESERGGTRYSYRVADLPYDADDMIAEYGHLLEQRGYEHTANTARGDNVLKIFFNARNGMMVTVGLETVRRLECVTVHISD